MIGKFLKKGTSPHDPRRKGIKALDLLFRVNPDYRNDPFFLTIQKEGLRPGQLLKGQVLEIQGEKALIEYQDTTFWAELAGEIPDQGEIVLRVIGHKEGRLILKYQNQGESEKTLQERGSKLLTQLGLKETPVNKELIKLYLQYQIPLKKESIQSLIPLLGEQEMKEKPLKEALVYLLKGNFSTHKESLQSLRTFLSKDLGTILNELESTMMSKIPEGRGEEILRERDSLEVKVTTHKTLPTDVQIRDQGASSEKRTFQDGQNQDSQLLKNTSIDDLKNAKVSSEVFRERPDTKREIVAKKGFDPIIKEEKGPPLHLTAKGKLEDASSLKHDLKHESSKTEEPLKRIIEGKNPGPKEGEMVPRLPGEEKVLLWESKGDITSETKSTHLFRERERTIAFDNEKGVEKSEEVNKTQRERIIKEERRDGDSLLLQRPSSVKKEDLLVKLGETLKALTLKPSSEEITPEKIKSLIENLGLDYEQKLLEMAPLSPNRSLKGILLTLLQSQDLEEGEMKEARDLLHFLTGKQIYNLISDDLFYLQIPFYSEKGWDFFEIFLKRKPPERNEEQGEIFSISLFFTTTYLGEIGVRILLQDKILSLDFYTSLRETGKILEERREELMEFLRSKGLMVKRMSFSDLGIRKKEEHFSRPSIQKSPLFYQQVDLKV